MPTLITWEDDSRQTQFVRFDVVTLESHEGTVQVTEHPVESGSDIADHARPDLARFSLEGFVSNSPLLSNPNAEEFLAFESVELELPEKLGGPPPFTPGGVVQAVGDLFAGAEASSATLLTPSEFRNRVREMSALLEEARLNGRLTRIETESREYEDMLMERVAAVIAPEDGDGARFQLDFKEVRFVSSQTVAAPVPAEVRGQTEGASGSKAAQQSKNDEKKAEDMKSLAAKLFDGGAASLGDFF